MILKLNLEKAYDRETLSKPAILQTLIIGSQLYTIAYQLHPCASIRMSVLLKPLRPHVAFSKGICYHHTSSLFALRGGKKLIIIIKSKILFSTNIVDAEVRKMSDILQILRGTILSSQPNKQAFDFFPAKRQNKLSGWKVTPLSQASRITLAQASLYNISRPRFFVASICDEAECICRNFIWSTIGNHCKCHLRKYASERRWLGFQKSQDLQLGLHDKISLVTLSSSKQILGQDYALKI
ncbi:hypothetical protein CR513_43549, partial [Mucuna pruriens]